MTVEPFLNRLHSEWENLEGGLATLSAVELGHNCLTKLAFRDSWFVKEFWVVKMHYVLTFVYKDKVLP